MGEARKKKAGRGPGAIPKLPFDVWREIWGELSPTQQHQIAGVDREWRRECTSNRWDKAVETLPDLSTPQQALRGIQRVLCRQSPFSAKHLLLRGPMMKRRCTDWYGFANENNSDMSHMTLLPWDEAEKGGGVFDRLRVVVFWNTSFNGLRTVHITWSRKPRRLLVNARPVGLRLAWTGGFQGCSCMPGSLALRQELCITWVGTCVSSKRLWPLG